MKVEVEQKEKQFKPIKLVITIESIEEAKALIDMCLHNETIPELVGCDNYITVQTFLNELSNILHREI